MHRPDLKHLPFAHYIWISNDLKWINPVAGRRSGAGNPNRKEWTKQDEILFIRLLSEGVEFTEISKQMMRSLGGLKAKMFKLRRAGRIESYKAPASAKPQKSTVSYIGWRHPGSGSS